MAVVDSSDVYVSCFAWVPNFAAGLVRDLRVRWALEEAGVDYREIILDFPTAKGPDYRQRQPFGQVPIYGDGTVELFESGAIALRIAEASPALMPRDKIGRAHAIQWLFAALNSIEIFVQQLGAIDRLHKDESWTAERRPQLVDTIRERLGILSAHLEGRDYLEDSFTIGDLMMATVLRILRHTELVQEQPVLAAYLRRCEERQAFGRALDAQLSVFARTKSEKAAAEKADA